MTPERWKRVEELYHAAQVHAPGERSAFLDRECSDDPGLREEVASLLDEQVDDGFLARPAAAMKAPVVSAVATAVMTGQRLGAYHLQSLLGAGGMGEVYRSHDTKLGRDVAIKILPTAFTRDPNRLARFAREARMLAALSHPNICAIYGLEEADGVQFLVLELVEGVTLAELVRRGGASSGLPTADALTIARQIADALEVAHEKGIVHRDLKPANIIIQGAWGPTPTPYRSANPRLAPAAGAVQGAETAAASVDSPVQLGSDLVVKVLDFGLAKSVGADDGTSGHTRTPGVTDLVGGIVVGTPAYMSPEQARGLPVDKRSDIWAFGCLVYEMLTGSLAFAGDTVSDTIAKVLEREPNWRSLPETTPAPIRRLLLRCLTKDPKQRLRDIGDARIEIDAIGEAVPGAPDGTAPTSPRARCARSRWLPWVAVGRARHRARGAAGQAQSPSPRESSGERPRQPVHALGRDRGSRRDFSGREVRDLRRRPRWSIRLVAKPGRHGCFREPHAEHVAAARASTPPSSLRLLGRRCGHLVCGRRRPPGTEGVDAGDWRNSATVPESS